MSAEKHSRITFFEYFHTVTVYGSPGIEADRHVEMQPKIGPAFST